MFVIGYPRVFTLPQHIQTRQIYNISENRLLAGKHLLLVWSLSWPKHCWWKCHTYSCMIVSVHGCMCGCMGACVGACMRVCVSVCKGAFTCFFIFECAYLCLHTSLHVYMSFPSCSWSINVIQNMKTVILKEIIIFTWIGHGEINYYIKQGGSHTHAAAWTKHVGQPTSIVKCKHTGPV